MNDNPLIFLIGGAIFLFIGLNGLRNREVYLGRLIRFIGPKLVLKGRLSVLMYGVLISAAGVLAILSGIGILISPESDLVDQIMPLAVYAFLGGFFGSMVVEFIYFSANLPPYNDTDPEEVSDRYRNTYR